MGVIPNRPESIRKLVTKLGPAEGLRLAAKAWSFFFLDGLCTGRNRNNKFNQRWEDGIKGLMLTRQQSCHDHW